MKFGKFLAAVCPLLAALMMMGGLLSPSAAEPATARYGVYLTRLDDFNIRGTSFSATFWLFTESSDREDQTFKTLEFPNATKVDFTNQLAEDVGGRFWLQERIQGNFRHGWDLSHYPFTRQTLQIEIEATSDADKVMLEPDVANTGFDKDISISGWRIESVRLVPSRKTYDSNFGDPRLPPRNGQRLFPADA